MIEPGQPAPAFTLPDQDGNDVSLAGFAGRTLVAYFYPKASTSGCTTQACGVRDRAPDYADAGATVVGVSNRYWGATRSTFIVDGDGVVRHVIPKSAASSRPAPRS